MIEIVNPKNCKHDKGYDREKIGEDLFARCKGCKSMHRVNDYNWPEDWDKVGDDDE